MKKLLLNVLFFSLLALNVSAQSLRLIPFQGRLTDAQGNSVPDGTKLIQFQIYGDPIGGSALWAGEVHRTTVNGGLVNVLLGSKNPLPNDRSDNSGRSFFDGTLYLQITVDTSGPSGGPDGQITASDPPLLPRQAILPVVFANESANSRNSQKLNGYDWSAILVAGASSNNPVTGRIDGRKLAVGTLPGDRLSNASITANQIAAGTLTSPQIAPGGITASNLAIEITQALCPAGVIVAFGGDANKIPKGWLLCNGEPVSAATYPALLAAIGTGWGDGTLNQDGSTSRYVLGTGFNLPDLGGLFLRGVDSTPDHHRDRDYAGRLPIYPGQNSKDAVGSYQYDALQEHKHNSLSGWGFANGSPGGIAGGGPYIGPPDPTTGGIDTGDGGRASGETRPQNVYVNYIIKY